MSFEPHARPPVAAFPLPALAATDLDDAEMRPPNVATPAGFRGCHYILATGRELWHKAYRCSLTFMQPSQHLMSKTSLRRCHMGLLIEVLRAVLWQMLL